MGDPALAAHATTLDRMTAAAARLLARGLLDEAASVAQSAAGLMALNHPGRFADPGLEGVLAGCAAALPQVPWTGGDGALHVLSNTSLVGGHTRLAWRWMARDAARRHSFVVPRPLGPAPQQLLDAAAEEHLVPGHEAGLLATAGALRALAARHDLVVLHVQPNDPLASLAFAGLTDRPPTLLCDHADHCFWLGRDAADVVVGHRAFAARLTTERRGVPGERCATVPLPLDPVVPTTEDARAAARDRLRLSTGTRLVLTIGTGYKYDAGDRHLLDALEPLVAEDGDTLLVAVGPAPEGRWADAHARTGGRVTATGVLPDLGDLLAAADVLVEAYPCSSGTAAVEAAQTGLPVLAWAPEDEEAAMLGSAGAAAGLWPSYVRAADLRAAVRELLEDPTARRAAGTAARAAVDEHHGVDRWREAMHRAEAAARALGPVRRTELAAPPTAALRTDELLHDLHARTGHGYEPAVLDRVAAMAEAVARWPVLTACFVPGLAGRTTHLEPVRALSPLVAAPGGGEEALAVAALRVLLASGLAASATVALEPAAVADGVARLEAALADGGDVDLDVLPCATPAELCEGRVVLRTPQDRFGTVPPGPLQLDAS